MREIKFRAWDKVNNKMVYPCSPKNDTYLVFEETGWFVVDHFTGKNETILTSENGELMQSTGLKDKNGKEIYEKDLVRITTPVNQIQKKSIISEIGFLDSSFCAYWRSTEIWEGYSVSPSSVYYLNCLITSDQIEVIGNIYETPTP